jgi:hypothetical protein
VHEPHVSELLARLKPEDLVVDVGGWACPFNRAQWIIDAEPYETRGFYRTFGGKPFQGPEREWFTKDTWLRRDICAKDPFPFPRDYFDFVICSHTLEDVRDPLWVCSELRRIGKRGYIEVPSRAFESIRAVERPGQVGLNHHRWLIEIESNHVKFLQKYHSIHSHWRFSLPASLQQRMTPEQKIQWLWWDGTFDFSEVTVHGVHAQDEELERFVRDRYPYPQWLLAADELLRSVKTLGRRATGKARRMLGTWSRSGRARD